MQIQELESEFEKIAQEKPVPTRYLRSQQNRVAKVAGEGDANIDEENTEGIYIYVILRSFLLLFVVILSPLRFSEEFPSL